MEVSKILNTESIQVSKDLNLELKKITDNSDNPFNERNSYGVAMAATETTSKR